MECSFPSKRGIASVPAIGAFSDADDASEFPWAGDTEQLRPSTVGDSQALEQEVALLTSRVGDALASEQKLAATNAQLRRELDGWVSVGTKVMKREAEIVKAIKDSDATDQQQLRAAIMSRLAMPKSDDKLPLALSGKTSAVAEAKSQTQSAAAGAKSETHLPKSIISWHYLVAIFTLVAVMTFCWLRAPGTISGLFKRQRLYEFSELQLEGVQPGFGEGYMLVQPSSGHRVRTRVSDQVEDSSVLRFSEVLTVPSQKGDRFCSITIFQRGDIQDTRVGTANIDLPALNGRSYETPCQYFRFKVLPDSMASRQQLHVAMRIRDITGIAGGKSQAMPIGSRKSAAFCV